METTIRCKIQGWTLGFGVEGLGLRVVVYQGIKAWKRKWKLLAILYLEGQGDFINILITPISHIMTDPYYPH